MGTSKLQLAAEFDDMDGDGKSCWELLMRWDGNAKRTSDRMMMVRVFAAAAVCMKANSVRCCSYAAAAFVVVYAAAAWVGDP